MEQTYHRGVFSWPSDQWTQHGSLCPSHLGVDVIQHEAVDDLCTLVDNATMEGRDESVAIFDLGVVVERYLLWKDTFPFIQPFYAMKAYDDPVVISVLTRLGAGLDCSSKKELDIALKCGVAPSSIIFASTVKFPSHLTFADTNDVPLMTVDNEEEMHKIQIYAPRAKLVIRMAPLTTAKVELALNVKFGCSREGTTRLLQLARQLDLEVVGISFHVGSGCSDPQTYINHIKAAHQLFDDALKEGFQLKLLDIGGGLFGNVEAEQHLKMMAGPIQETLEEVFPRASGVKVIAEPGRYFVESALSLATCVIGKRLPGNGLLQIPDVNEPSLNGVREKPPPAEVAFEYYISESVFGLLVQHMYIKGYQYIIHPLKVASVYPPAFAFKDTQKCPVRDSIQAPQGAPTYSSKLWGPSMDSVDLVTEHCPLPELYIGDWLVFRDVGSYSVVVGGTFNGFQPPTIHRVIQQAAWDKLMEAITSLARNQI